MKQSIAKRIIAVCSSVILSTAFVMNASAYNGTFIGSDQRTVVLPYSGYLAQGSNDLYSHEFSSASIITSGAPTYCRVNTVGRVKIVSGPVQTYNFGYDDGMGGGNQHVSDSSYTFYGLRTNHVFSGEDGTKFTLTTGNMHHS